MTSDVSAGVLSDTEINIFLDLTTFTVPRSKKKTLDKWDSLMGIEVIGTPKAEDTAELNKVMNDINEVMGREVISVGQYAPNLLICFVSAKEFKAAFHIRQLPRGVYFSFIRDEKNALEAALLYIDPHLVGETRQAAIRGGVTRALGFSGRSKAMRHSTLHESLSVYAPEYTELEKKFIKLIFHDAIKAGMNRKELKTALMSLNSLDDSRALAQIDLLPGAVSTPAMRHATTAPSIYHIFFNGVQEGPYNKVQIGKMLSAGRIDANVLGWKQGTPAEWKPIIEVIQ